MTKADIFEIQYLAFNTITAANQPPTESSRKTGIILDAAEARYLECDREERVYFGSHFQVMQYSSS